MPHLQFEPYPTVEPRPAPPDDYQHIGVPPQAFGAQVGAGAERLGAGLSAAGKFYGQVAASDATNQLMEGTAKILNGDPDKTTMGPDGQPQHDLGYLGTRGRDALDKQAYTAKALETLRTQLRGNLSTAESQLEFDDFSRRFLAYKSGEIGTHADQQANVWYGQVEKAKYDNALAGIRSNPNDQTQVDHYTAMAMQSRLQTISRTVGTAQGPDTDAMVNDALTQTRADAAENRIDALIPTNPSAAQQILNSPSGVLLKGPRYDALSAKLQTTTDAADAHALVFGGSGINLRPGAVSAGPAADPRGLVPLIRQTAQKYGIDPDTAVAVARSEGLANPHGDLDAQGNPTSFSAFQLHKAPGAMGADFQRDTGLDPADPKNEPAAIDYALHRASQEGWSAFHGAARAGIGERQGIGGTGTSEASAQPSGMFPMTEEQAQVPGLSQKLAEIEASGANPRVKAEAARLATQTYNAQWTDETRSYELHQRAVKQASDDRANQVVTDMASPNPSITAQSVRTDPHLTWETKEHLIAAMQAHPTSDPQAAAQAYGSGFWAAYKGITAPPGDPSRVTDQNAILRRAGPGGDLTLAGAEKLVGVMGQTRRPEAQGDLKMQAGALAYAKHQLSFEADYGVLKVRDPKGEDAFNIGFTPAFFKYWEGGIATGKTPEELANKDAIDKLAQPFKRAEPELMRDKLEAGTESEAGAATPSGPPAAAVAYLRANPGLRPAFDQKYGPGSAEGILGPQPPIAH